MNFADYLFYTLFLCFFFLSVYALAKNHKALINRLYALLFFCFSINMLTQPFIINMNKGIDFVNIVLDVYIISGMCWYSLVFLVFLVYTNRQKHLKTISIALSLVVIIIVILQFSGYMFTAEYIGNNTETYELVWNNPILINLANGFMYVLIFSGFIFLFIFHKQTKDKLEKKRSLILLIFGSITFILTLFLYINYSKINPIYYGFIMAFFISGIAYCAFFLDVFELTPSTIGRNIARITPNAILISDRSHKITFANTQFYRMTTLTDADVLNAKLPDLLNKLTGENILEEHPTTCSEKAKIILPDGTKRAVFLRCKAIETKRHVKGMITVITDVSKLEEAENKILEINQSLEQRILERTINLRQRDAYLTAINSTTTLLLNEPIIPYNKYIKVIGNVANACRAFVFLHQSKDATKTEYSLKAGYFKAVRKLKENKHELLPEIFDRLPKDLFEKINKGKIIQISQSDLMEKEKHLLEDQNIKNFMVLPLIKENCFYGFLWFDNCILEKKWSEKEVSLLMTAANNLAQAIVYAEVNDAYKRSEKKYREIIEQSRDAIFVYADNRFTLVNQSFINTFGYNLDELNDIGIDIYNIVEPHEFLQNIKKINSNKSLNFINELQEFTVIARDGSQIFCEASFSHIGEKKEIALQGIIRNVTERKKHENELLKAKQIAEENEERFKALHNASFGGISIHDKGVILECNQGLSEMTGYSIDELIGMDGLLLIAPESRNMVIKNMMKAYEKPYEAFGLRKNGEIFPLQLEARNIPYKGKTVRTVEFRDITERKQIENEIHQTNAQLKRLAGHLQNIREEERLVISRELHDNLGQSLTAMRMELFYLKEQINSSEISKDKAQLLDDYENMIESFDAIVKSVREISRNIRPSIIEDFGLIPAIEWLITEFEQRYKIDCDVSIKRGLTIELEKKNLIGIYRIAQESLTNIVKHANATKVHVSLDQTKEKYCMKISDNGTGFDFKTSKNKKTLGLIGMKERAFMFNGKINITGTPGKGTVVEVIIPVKQRKNTSL